jgi:hypothetical protein
VLGTPAVGAGSATGRFVNPECRLIRPTVHRQIPALHRRVIGSLLDLSHITWQTCVAHQSPDHKLGASSGHGAGTSQRIRRGVQDRHMRLTGIPVTGLNHTWPPVRCPRYRYRVGRDREGALHG